MGWNVVRYCYHTQNAKRADLILSIIQKRTSFCKLLLNVFSTNEGVYSQLLATKGVDWFASYVYSLRNALFHEIITPLDEEWQTIFKSAYLILKQISDICIAMINRVMEFPQSKENLRFPLPWHRCCSSAAPTAFDPAL